VVLAVYTASHAASVTHGFAAYYAASRSFLDGGLGPWVYDDETFEERVRRFAEAPVRDVFGPNPPTMALLVLPLAPLDHGRARTVWLVSSLAALIVGVIALVQTVGARDAWLPMVCLLLAPSVFANLRTGQAYLVLFGGFALAAWALAERRDRLAGSILGLIAIVKLVAVPWIVLLAIRGRWRAVMTSVGVSGGVAVVTLPWIEPSTWMAFPDAVRSFVARPSTSVTAYQTTVGFLRHLCVGDAVWNPDPIGGCARAASILPFVVLAAAWAVSARLIRRVSEPQAVAMAACLSLLTVPIAEDHHFAMLGIPLVVLRDFRPRWLWFVAAGLVLVPAGITISFFTQGWLALLAYPRLYAAWLMWGALVWQMRHSSIWSSSNS
jgi:hypothetical protein